MGREIKYHCENTALQLCVVELRLFKSCLTATAEGKRVTCSSRAVSTMQLRYMPLGVVKD